MVLITYHDKQLLTIKGNIKNVLISNGNPLKLRCQCHDANCSKLSWQTPKRGHSNQSNSVESEDFRCTYV